MTIKSYCYFSFRQTILCRQNVLQTDCRSKHLKQIYKFFLHLPQDLEEGILVEALGWPPDTDQPNAVRRKQARLRYLWSSVKQTDLTLVLVLPVTNEKVSIT